MIIYTALKEEWNNIKLKKEFVSDDFEQEGFIHCSNPNQTIGVLNKHFKNKSKVILLCIDEKYLKEKCIQEDLKNTGEKFPHVYGNINVDFIIKTIEIYRGEDGKYTENKELLELINYKKY